MTRVIEAAGSDGVAALESCARCRVRSSSCLTYRSVRLRLSEKYRKQRWACPSWPAKVRSPSESFRHPGYRCREQIHCGYGKIKGKATYLQRSEANVCEGCANGGESKIIGYETWEGESKSRVYRGAGTGPTAA